MKICLPSSLFSVTHSPSSQDSGFGGCSSWDWYCISYFASPSIIRTVSNLTNNFQFQYFWENSLFAWYMFVFSDQKVHPWRIHTGDMIKKSKITMMPISRLTLIKVLLIIMKRQKKKNKKTDQLIQRQDGISETSQKSHNEINLKNWKTRKWKIKHNSEPVM